MLQKPKFVMHSLCTSQGLCVVATGLPDFHSMVATIMKTTFQRLSLKIRTYRNYDKLDNLKFRETLVKDLSLTNTWNNDINNFIDICMRSLDKHEPLKKKYTRGNHFPFINPFLPNQRFSDVFKGIKREHWEEKG